jgi:predicted metal-dependent enzyme (double-stranded beta helix superfamily)
VRNVPRLPALYFARLGVPPSGFASASDGNDETAKGYHVTIESAVVEMQQFIDEVQVILVKNGNPPSEQTLAEIGERMKGLVRRDDLEELHQKAQAEGRRLFSVPDGLQLMLAHFPATTAIHTHGAWGVMAGYRGVERYKQWVREDDGSKPGVGKLRLIRDVEVKPGDVGWWLPPPNDIHQQLPDERGSVELILMGNPPAEKRLYFDVEQGTYEEATPAERHYPGR